MSTHSRITMCASWTGHGESPSCFHGSPFVYPTCAVRKHEKERCALLHIQKHIRMRDCTRHGSQPCVLQTSARCSGRQRRSWPRKARLRSGAEAAVQCCRVGILRSRVGLSASGFAPCHFVLPRSPHRSELCEATPRQTRGEPPIGLRVRCPGRPGCVKRRLSNGSGVVHGLQLGFGRDVLSIYLVASSGISWAHCRVGPRRLSGRRKSRVRMRRSCLRRRRRSRGANFRDWVWRAGPVSGAFAIASVLKVKPAKTLLVPLRGNADFFAARSVAVVASAGCLGVLLGQRVTPEDRCVEELLKEEARACVRRFRSGMDLALPPSRCGRGLASAVPWSGMLPVLLSRINQLLVGRIPPWIFVQLRDVGFEHALQDIVRALVSRRFVASPCRWLRPEISLAAPRTMPYKVGWLPRPSLDGRSPCWRPKWWRLHRE